jgi:7,8-dihydropterin-6-yl-methyl-4-(beta-D-ribofuranosyl)aminobenzene 5'-phosphate synthase
MTHASLQILADNRAEGGLEKEHGLSMWIEVDGRRILFDTGTGKIVESNARKLGIDMYSADFLVLSHGHYDHSGGVAPFLQHSRQSHVYCHPGAVMPRYAVRNGADTPIHMPHASMAAMDKLSEKRLHWVQEPLRLGDHIGLTGHIPRKMSFEDTGGPFYFDPAGKRPDPIDDDMALWIRTNKGLVVVTGCCHAGVVNTLSYIFRLNNGMKIRALIGGFHLMGASPLRLELTMQALQAFEIDLLVPCHCTGQAAIELLKKTFDIRVSPGAAGKLLRF